MLHVNFNTYSNYVTDSLYQWDINQVLSITGVNITSAPEVHFSNANMDRAVVRQASLSSGVIVVNIPNSLLQMALTIKAYIGIYEGETFKVIEMVEIPVIPRTRPSDYVFEDTDGEIYSFKAIENMVNNVLNSNGDMRRETYDQDNDGVVDNAKKLDGHGTEYFATKDDMNNAMPKSGGTFTGDVIAYATNRATQCLRNIKVTSNAGTSNAYAVSTSQIVMQRK